MGNNSHKPAIRFQGFTDAWEQRKLGDMAEIIGGGTPSTANTSYWDGDIDWYAPAEIADQIYVSSSQRKITKEGYENSSAKMLPVGTVLFTSRAGIGKTAILSKESCTNQGFQSIVPNKELLDSYFIFSRTDELKNYGETVGAGSTFVEVSGKQMAQMTLMMPTSLTEQQKIGEFFESLDNLITLHQRKYEKLLTVKKSMLEKMFPRDGSNNPEIRFIGFTDPWEQRKLGEWCDFINGDRSSNYPSATEFVENGIPFVGSDSLGSTLVDKTKLRFITTEKYEQMNGLKIEANDILYTLRGAGFGKCSIADFTGGTVASSLVGIRCKEILRSKFLIQWLCSSNAEHEKNKAVNGSTAQNISVEDMKKYNVTVPSLAEQEKISEYLYNLDNLITLHQRKLEKLKNIKQSLLQNMFV